MKYLLFILLMFSASILNASTSTATTDKWQAELEAVRAEIDYTQNNKVEVAQAFVNRIDKALERYEGKPRRQAQEGNITMREHLENLKAREQSNWAEYTPGKILKRLRDREKELEELLE